jgi:hypothetical protein
MAVAGSAQKAAEADGRAQGRQLIDLQHCASYREVDLRPPVVVRQGHNNDVTQDCCMSVLVLNE